MRHSHMCVEEFKGRHVSRLLCMLAQDWRLQRWRRRCNLPKDSRPVRWWRKDRQCQRCTQNRGLRRRQLGRGRSCERCFLSQNWGLARRWRQEPPSRLLKQWEKVNPVCRCVVASLGIIRLKCKLLGWGSRRYTLQSRRGIGEELSLKVQLKARWC